MRKAVYTGTRNVYPDMVTACKSLLAHGGADVVYFLIEDDAFPDPLPEAVRCINVSKQTFFLHGGPNFNSRWTYMTLMKAAVPLMFTGRVLVLDIDTIVDGSLEKLWKLPRKPLYMALEVGRNETYYNAGVMLMDTDAFRKDARQIVQIINTQRLPFNEQDAINLHMRGRIAQLPPEYNVSAWTVKPEGEAIITHYAAVREWQGEELWRRYERMTWAEIAPLISER